MRRRGDGGPVLTFVHIESDSTDRNPDHALWVVEKLNGLRVQGKIISVLEIWDTESGDINTAARMSYSERRGAAGNSLSAGTYPTTAIVTTNLKHTRNASSHLVNG